MLLIRMVLDLVCVLQVLSKRLFMLLSLRIHEEAVVRVDKFIFLD